MRNPLTPAAPLLLALAVLAGCGDTRGPQLGAVCGRVTRDGRPLQGATVLFKAPGAPGAIGTTDAHGRYDLTYIGKYPGAVVGKNDVSIFVPPETAVPSEGEGLTVLFEGSRLVEPGSQTINFDL